MNKRNVKYDCMFKLFHHLTKNKKLIEVLSRKFFLFLYKYYTINLQKSYLNGIEINVITLAVVAYANDSVCNT